MKIKKGFTLIELIVALLFFTLASASIAVFYASNSRRIISSERSARLEAVSGKVYETFKGDLMQRIYDPGGNYEKLVFDTIWETFNPGDMIFSSSDTINGVTFNSSIRIDSFHFDTTKAATKDEARGYSSGSRIWSTIETIDLSNGDTIQMQTVFSHHR
jgi:prepilin-type N-terminal cleavage/methylation domain-containing protein